MSAESDPEVSAEQAQQLRERFRQTGDVTYLMLAVDAYEALVAAQTGPGRAGMLVQYANSVLARYQAVGDPRDIDLALQVAHEAVAHAGDLPGPRAVALNVLASAHTAAYQMRGGTGDLFAALAAQRETVRVVYPVKQGRVAFAVNLANRLIFAFDVVRDPAMLDEAVELVQALLGEEMPDEWRAAGLNNLGLALRARYELTGHRDDLRDSLAAQQESLRLTAPDELERVNRLNNLANARWALYLSTGVLSDLDEAVTTYEAAAASPANPVSRAACLLGLGTARWNRWGRRQLPGDLDSAIAAFTTAAGLVDVASPTAAHCAVNLGAAYFARWRHTHQRIDLDLAVEHWSAARSNPLAEPEIVEAATSNLGGALWERHEDTSDIDDLQEAITLLGTAPDEARVTLQPGRIFTLAGALSRRFDLLADPADLDRGVVAYRRACQLGLAANPGVALNSGQQWGAWAAGRQAYEEADEAYAAATAAAVSLFSRQGSDEHTEVWLGEATTLSARQAFVQVQRGHLNEAVVTLDRGRAYVLSEALRTGTQGESELAEVNLRQILAAGASQPLIYLAATPWGGVGLKADAHDVTPLQLPKLTEQALISIAHEFVGAAERRDTDMRRWHNTITATCEALWELVVGPMLDQLGGIDRAVIVPSGWLTLLPLHAARQPGKSDADALDRACLTYAPNARLLTDARVTASAIKPRSALIVDAPHRPDLAPLPFSDVEAAHAATARSSVEHLRGTDATIDRVLHAITRHDLLHLSCHATAHPTRGWSSRLELADGPLTVEHLRQHRSQALLAFLSACETAVVSLQLPDEVVAFPSVLLAAGVAGVAASLWPVPQAATAYLVAVFYDQLPMHPPAEALRRAQQQVRAATGAQINHRLRLPAKATLRNEAHPFSHPYFWAGFTYTGA